MTNFLTKLLNNISFPTHKKSVDTERLLSPTKNNPTTNTRTRNYKTIFPEQKDEFGEKNSHSSISDRSDRIERKHGRDNQWLKIENSNYSGPKGQMELLYKCKEDTLYRLTRGYDLKQDAIHVIIHYACSNYKPLREEAHLALLTVHHLNPGKIEAALNSYYQLKYNSPVVSSLVRGKINEISAATNKLTRSIKFDMDLNGKIEKISARDLAVLASEQETREPGKHNAYIAKLISLSIGSGNSELVARVQLRNVFLRHQDAVFNQLAIYFLNLSPKAAHFFTILGANFRTLSFLLDQAFIENDDPSKAADLLQTFW